MSQAPSVLVALAARKAIAILLLLSLSSTSLFAAPDAARTIISSAGEISRDIQFDYLSLNPATTLGRWTNYFLLFFEVKEETPQPSRIEIIPGDGTTIRQGEPVNFTAIGYTVDGVPVGGLRFDWTIQDAAGAFPAKNLADGAIRSWERENSSDRRHSKPNNLVHWLY